MDCLHFFEWKIGLFLEKMKKSHYDTFIHSLNVSYYANLIGKELDFNKEELRELLTAALYHDLGKTFIRKDILDKPSALSTYERALILQHPLFSARELQQNEDMHSILPHVLQHHERWDGEGYPFGLKGTEITLFARIISISDAFDAMVSFRPYQKRKTVIEALNELEKQKGKQFDPEIVEVFQRVLTDHLCLVWRNVYPAIIGDL